MPSGVYFLNTSDINNLSDKPNASFGRSVWIYCGTGDEKVGLLICSRNGTTYIGYCFGKNALTWITK